MAVSRLIIGDTKVFYSRGVHMIHIIFLYDLRPIFLRKSIMQQTVHPSFSIDSIGRNWGSTRAHIGRISGVSPI
jgi:hypothetical protein